MLAGDFQGPLPSVSLLAVLSLLISGWGTADVCGGVGIAWAHTTGRREISAEGQGFAGAMVPTH